MRYMYLIVMICTPFTLGTAQNTWVETSQSDFMDGIYERNLYASNRGGGAVEFAPRFDQNNDRTPLVDSLDKDRATWVIAS
jgi:hypothetical protein